jgi:hypothetical protein
MRENTGRTRNLRDGWRCLEVDWFVSGTWISYPGAIICLGGRDIALVCLTSYLFQERLGPLP